MAAMVCADRVRIEANDCIVRTGGKGGGQDAAGREGIRRQGWGLDEFRV